MKHTNILITRSNLNLQLHQRGISLIIVLILVVIVGLTSAAALRSATSGQRLTNNVRMENMAQQYAEAALRYCEEQLQIPDTNTVAPVRPNSLKGAKIPYKDMTVALTKGNWENTATWTSAAGAGAAATRTALSSTRYSTAGLSSSQPAKAPECAAEIQQIGSPTFKVTVVTARGFSSDYAADVNGQTTKGSVVWLQSVLNMCAGDTVTCP